MYMENRAAGMMLEPGFYQYAPDVDALRNRFKHDIETIRNYFATGMTFGSCI